MENKKLVELAAKAAGIAGTWHRSGYVAYSGWCGSVFDPLNDDGDALRLAVNIGISIELSDYGVDAVIQSGRKFEGWGSCIECATRRAITRAAAQIGKEME